MQITSGKASGRGKYEVADIPHATTASRFIRVKARGAIWGARRQSFLKFLKV